MPLSPSRHRQRAAAVLAICVGLSSAVLGVSAASALTTSPDPTAAATIEDLPQPITHRVSGVLTGIPSEASDISYANISATSPEHGWVEGQLSGTTFVFDALPDGDWSIEAHVYASTAMSEVHYSTWSALSGTDAVDVVVAGEDIANVEIALAGSGAFGGVVTGDEAPADIYTRISTYAWNGSSWSEFASSTGWGEYEMGLVRLDRPNGEFHRYTIPVAADWVIGFSDPAGLGEPLAEPYPYCEMFWSDAFTKDDAEAVVLPSGGIATGIDQTLQLKSDGCETKGVEITPSDVSITGSPVVGNTLSAETEAWEPAPVELAYQWFVDDRPVAGATAAASPAAVAGGTGATLELQPEYVGKTVRVEVTGSRPDAASVTVSSVETAPVVARGSNTLEVTVPSEAGAGTAVPISGSGWQPGETVTVDLRGADGTVVSTQELTAGEDGSVSGAVTLPDGPAETFEVRLSGESGTATAMITSVESPVVTPTTPAPTTPAPPTPAPTTAAPTTPAPTGPGAVPAPSNTSKPMVLAATGVDAPWVLMLGGFVLAAVGVGAFRLRTRRAE